MTNEIIVEMAIEGHSSTRDAIRWAMAQEREAIIIEFEKRHEAMKHRNNYWLYAANYIRAREQE